MERASNFTASVLKTALGMVVSACLLWGAATFYFRSPEQQIAVPSAECLDTTSAECRDPYPRTPSESERTYASADFRPL